MSRISVDCPHIDKFVTLKKYCLHRAQEDKSEIIVFGFSRIKNNALKKPGKKRVG